MKLILILRTCLLSFFNLTTPAQGDIMYFNGTDWVSLVSASAAKADRTTAEEADRTTLDFSKAVNFSEASSNPHSFLQPGSKQILWHGGAQFYFGPEAGCPQDIILERQTQFVTNWVTVEKVAGKVGTIGSDEEIQVGRVFTNEVVTLKFAGQTNTVTFLAGKGAVYDQHRIVTNVWITATTTWPPTSSWILPTNRPAVTPTTTTWSGPREPTAN